MTKTDITWQIVRTAHLYSETSKQISFRILTMTQFIKAWKGLEWQNKALK